MPASLLLALCASEAGAADPLQTPECRAARLELDQATAAAAEAHAGLTPRLSHARKKAAADCLGREATGERIGSPAPLAVPASRIAPIEPIEPPRIDRSSGVAAGLRAPAVSLPPAPLEILRPSVVTNCDPGGCRDANGQRLNSFGASPVLIGPKGPCVVTNGLAVCP